MGSFWGDGIFIMPSSINSNSSFVISDKSLTAMEIRNGAFTFNISSSSGLNKTVVSSMIRLESILIPTFSRSCFVLTSVLYRVIMASSVKSISSLGKSNLSTKYESRMIFKKLVFASLVGLYSILPLLICSMELWLISPSNWCSNISIQVSNLSIDCDKTSLET